MSQRFIYRRCMVYLLSGVVIGGLALLFLYRVHYPRRNPEFAFSINRTPTFLTDETAIEKAREAIILAGLDPSVWQAQEDGRTKDPSNKRDKYLARNSINPNRGVILFTNTEDNRSRLVSVVLDNNKVICQVNIGK